MSHMSSHGAACQSGCGSSRIVTYTATGAEGIDFMVPIGTALASDGYTVLWAPAGVSNVPVLDLPNTQPGDRTQTHFRVALADVLTLGDVLTFVISED